MFAEPSRKLEHYSARKTEGCHTSPVDQIPRLRTPVLAERIKRTSRNATIIPNLIPTHLRHHLGFKNNPINPTDSYCCLLSSFGILPSWNVHAKWKLLFFLYGLIKNLYWFDTSLHIKFNQFLLLRRNFPGSLLFQTSKKKVSKQIYFVSTKIFQKIWFLNRFGTRLHNFCPKAVSIEFCVDLNSFECNWKLWFEKKSFSAEFSVLIETLKKNKFEERCWV